jgi:2-keto-4-pentenoate hydratase/2-oxohepta-3-ene-1,7-dioic acid hydratase in catechol pathway
MRHRHRHEVWRAVGQHSQGRALQVVRHLGQRALRLRLWVNGELQQDESTADMVCPVTEPIAAASEVVTLEPADVIATGTPSGVGVSRGLYLRRSPRRPGEARRASPPQGPLRSAQPLPHELQHPTRGLTPQALAQHARGGEPAEVSR